MWTVREKEAFERSVAVALHGEMLTKIVVERFQAEVQVHPWVWPGLPTSVESVWQHGQIVIRYRLLSATKQVEVLSVTVDESGGAGGA